MEILIWDHNMIHQVILFQVVVEASYLDSSPDIPGIYGQRVNLV